MEELFRRASEAGLTPGTFRFIRTGSTAAPLALYDTVSGTATAGSDYVSLGTSLVIPAGVSVVEKTVTPLQDTLQEGSETIIVTLTPTSARSNDGIPLRVPYYAVAAARAGVAAVLFTPP